MDEEPQEQKPSEEVDKKKTDWYKQDLGSLSASYVDQAASNADEEEPAAVENPEPKVVEKPEAGNEGEQQ
jgi:hypothetical protein